MVRPCKGNEFVVAGTGAVVAGSEGTTAVAAECTTEVLVTEPEIAFFCLK